MKNQTNHSAVFSAIIDELPTICHTLCQAARECGMEEGNLWKLETAIDEACTNITCYGYSDEDEGKIWVDWECQGDEFVVRIKDEGIPFDQSQPTQPDFDKKICERQAGGLGRYIMKRFLDGMEYHQEEGKNVLILKKKLYEKDSTSEV